MCGLRQLQQLSNASTDKKLKQRTARKIIAIFRTSQVARCSLFLIYAAPYKKSESTKRLLISRYSPKQFKVSGCCSYLEIMDVVMEMNNSVK